MGESQQLLDELTKDVEPNPKTLTSISAFCDLLGLVVEEYVLRDFVPELTKEERYAIAHWASVCHVAAAEEDPPLPRPPEPACLSKVLLRPGRRVIVAVAGGGVVEDYDYSPGVGGSVLDYKRPVVKLDNGQKVYPRLEEILGVE